MILQVTHHTRYDYDREVSFSPHALYLRPRESAYHRLRRFQCTVQPAARLVDTLDSHDNPLIWAWIGGTGQMLEVRTDFEIETLDTNPFDFILHTGASNRPVDYDPAERFALSSYLAPPFDETQAMLLKWVERHLPETPRGSVMFLDAVNRAICENVEYNHREEGFSQPSVLTLEHGTGSCRDFAVLLIEILRTHGFASRFVSGYLFDPPEGENAPPAAMHAWVEVFLPGAGWKGLDPTRGVFCDDAFIPVAHAAQADQVTPIQGRYFSKERVKSRLTVSVSVTRGS